MCFSRPNVQAPPAPPPPPPPPTQVASRVETPTQTGSTQKRRRGTSQLTVKRPGSVGGMTGSGTGVNLNQ